MKLEEELNKLGIKHRVEMFNGSKFIECENGVRVNIYKDHITISDHTTLYSFPPRENSLDFILKVIKDNEPNK